MTRMDHLIHTTYVPCAKDLVSLAMNENEIEDFKQVQDTKTNYLKQCDGWILEFTELALPHDVQHDLFLNKILTSKSYEGRAWT